MNFNQLLHYTQETIDESFDAQWKSSASEITGMKDQHIPLTPTISKALGWSIPYRVAHFTDKAGIESVLSTQNIRRRNISTTTDFGDKFLGVHRMGNAAILEGNALYGSSTDIGTAPDNSGLRWVPVSSMVDGWYNQTGLKQELGNILTSDTSLQDKVGALETWVTANKHIFNTTDIKGDSSMGDDYYNEVILDKFKVIEVILNYQYLNSDREISQLVSKLKTDNIPYQLTRTSQEFHDIMNGWRPKLGN